MQIAIISLLFTLNAIAIATAKGEKEIETCSALPCSEMGKLLNQHNFNTSSSPLVSDCHYNCSFFIIISVIRHYIWYFAFLYIFGLILNPFPSTIVSVQSYPNCPHSQLFRVSTILAIYLLNLCNCSSIQLTCFLNFFQLLFTYVQFSPCSNDESSKSFQCHS